MTKFSLFLAAILALHCHSIFGGEIHEAAELGDLAKVGALLTANPKLVDSTDTKGRTVLARAILSGKKDLVELILDKGVTEDIYAAAVVGHVDKVAAALKQDPQLISAKDGSGKTALHWAAFYGQRKIVELLLAEKAEVDQLDEAGFTPLHWAAMFNRSEAAAILLGKRADLNLRVPRFGWTPLQLAVIHGHLATAELLLKAGADPNDPNVGTLPVLHQAVIHGDRPMILLLLANKADANLRDVDGETPLDEAVEIDKKEIIELLREHGAKKK